MPFTLYIAPRQSDKTRTSISWLLGDVENRVIICMNEMERRRVIKHVTESTSTEPWQWIDKVITWQDRTLLMGTPVKEVCIDNLDLLIQQMFMPHNIYAVTMSLENVIEPDSAKQN